jgi:ribosomal protein S18 acetylase RimI-like enzyme
LTTRSNAGASAIVVLDLTAVEHRTRLYALWRRAYQVEASLIGSNDFPPLRVSLEGLMQRPGRFHGLTHEGRLVGAVEVEELGSQTLQISALVVEPARARRGFGRRLVDFVLESAPASVVVSTSAANAPALALYRSVGFRQTRTLVSAEGITLCWLEWVRPGGAPDGVR